MKLLILLTILLFSCSGLEQSEQEKVRKQNVSKQRIYRKSDEKLYTLSAPTSQKRELYPWEKGYIGEYPKITKEFFRCKGSSSNLARLTKAQNGEMVHYVDCRGSEQHSLPMIDNKEFVYPILIQLLNYLQEKTNKKVVVTCGHRCPVHNTYSDGSIQNQASKHMIGAEVDFYVQGMEDKGEEIANLLMKYYENDKGYETFNRYKDSKDVSTPPWYNKEVFIKLYQKNEGRDLDNRHPYPYISIQVRFDRKKNEKVIYTWQKASQGYQRF